MSNFWKDRYKDQWEASNRRERLVSSRLLADAGVVTEFVGFGAGTTTYFSGSAKKYGKEKGGADLKVVGKELYFEVTGSHVPISPHKPIWIRPDKIITARKHYPDLLTCVIHCSADNTLLRAIPLGREFFTAIDNGELPLIEPVIRGNVERYVEIASNHPVVKSWDALVALLKS